VGNLSVATRGRLHLATTYSRGQVAASRRAVERPRRGDAARPRGRAHGIRGLGDGVSHIAGSRRIATHILAAEGDSQWYFYQGNYREYEENKHERLGDEAAAPHRLRYKPLQLRAPFAIDASARIRG